MISHRKLADVAVQRDLNETESRELVDSIRADVADLGDRIATAYKGRAWIALGYRSWDAMCDTEFDGARLRIPREDRAEQVQSLRAAGLSTRAIGSALGIGKATVARDLATGPNGPVVQPTTVGPMTDPMPGARPRDLLIRPLTPAEIAAARRTVASHAHAHDPADCRLLLDMLGLL